MTRIEEAAKQIKDEQFQNSARAQILRHINDRPDEVFRKIELTKELKKKGIRSNTVRTLIGQLWIEGKIGRYRVQNKGYSYYGTIEAVKKLRTLSGH